jgi:hypothetical protein
MTKNMSKNSKLLGLCLNRMAKGKELTPKQRLLLSEIPKPKYDKDVKWLHKRAEAFPTCASKYYAIARRLNYLIKREEILNLYFTYKP